MEFLTKNLALKIIAFVLALMFWFNVVTNKSYEHEFDVPFKLEQIPAELILTTPPPPTINVRLAGTGKQILAFLFKKPMLNFTASHFERGIYKVDLKPDDLHFDTEMHASVVAVNNPEQLTLKFEALDTKKVQVIPDVDIKPAAGYTAVGNLTLTPDSVTISGPRRFIRYLSTVTTEKLALDDLKKSVSTTLRLALDDTLFLTPDKNEFLVEQAIVPLAERKIGPVEIQTYNANLFTTAEFEPDSIYVIVEGPKGIVDSLRPDQISATINFRNITAGTTSVMPKVVIPQEFRLIGTEPTSLTVTAQSQ